LEDDPADGPINDSNNGGGEDDEDTSSDRSNYICEVGTYDGARDYLLCMLDRRPPTASTGPLGRGIMHFLRLFVE
jgi:hypothetical protein